MIESIDDTDDQYKAIADNIYDIFRSRVSTEITKEQNEIRNNELTEYEGSLKDKANLYAIRVIGKTFKNATIEGESASLGLSLAFDYGFKFKQFELLKKKPKRLPENRKLTEKMVFHKTQPDTNVKTKKDTSKNKAPIKQPSSDELESLAKETESRSENYDSTLDKAFVSAASSNKKFKYLINEEFKYNGPLILSFGTYDFNSGIKFLYTYSSTNVDILSSFELSESQESYDSNNVLMHTSHEIEYGRIINYRKYPAFGFPVLGMGYSFSAFRLYQSTGNEEVLSKSNTSGFYYFIEFVTFISDNYGIGLSYRSSLDNKNKKYWSGLRYSLNWHF